MCITGDVDRATPARHRDRLVSASDVRSALAERLPRGYRARPFEDADREPLVAARNAEAHPMEQETAAEWRRWESMFTDDTRIRMVVVSDAGAVAGSGNIQVGWMPRPDGAQHLNVVVHPEHRRRGIGAALLEAFEAEGRRRGVPRLLSGVSSASPFAVAFATKRGYREIGRRIMSYVELDAFEPERWRESVDRVEREGVRLRPIGDVLAGLDEGAIERFWRAVWEAEAPMWEDIPFSAPTPHWAFEQFYKMAAKSGQLLADASVVAYAGDRIVGFTETADRQGKDGWTWMTGVARDHRGRGVALALKVAALTLAKKKGLRAMCTVNDEPNKAMRGVNIKLGYQPVPDHIELEKRL